MNDLQLNEEYTLLKKSIRLFAEKEIEPFYEQWEKDGIIPQQLWLKLGEAGFLCSDLEEQYGGLELPYRFSSVVVEVFSVLGYAALAVNLTVHSQIVAHYIANYGTDEQKRRILPKMASGEVVGAIAMTEPGAGSDLQGIKATATLQNEQYTLNGSKTFITNGQSCDVLIVAAITNKEEKPSKGMSLFVLEDLETLTGFSRGRNLQKIGLHGCDTSELFFENIVLEQSALLGEENEGFHYLMNQLPRERLTLAVCAQGAMEGAMEQTIQYVQERTVFNQPLSKLQNTQFEIAEIATSCEVQRRFIDYCISQIEHNQLDTKTASMAKLSTTEVQCKVIDRCLQLFGGYGYMEEYPISRAFIDARVQRIYGGTSEIMKQIIGKSILNSTK